MYAATQGLFGVPVVLASYQVKGPDKNPHKRRIRIRTHYAVAEHVDAHASSVWTPEGIELFETTEPDMVIVVVVKIWDRCSSDDRGALRLPKSALTYCGKFSLT
jgi:hypothetical protein